MESARQEMLLLKQHAYPLNHRNCSLTICDINTDTAIFALNVFQKTLNCPTQAHIIALFYRDKESGYRKTSNIRRTLVGNEFVDHSDVVGASPVGSAPTTSSFST